MGKRPQQNKGKKKGGKRSRVQRDYDEGLDDDRCIDVALIDCEGCIETALSPKLAHQLKLILWEVRPSLVRK